MSHRLHKSDTFELYPFLDTRILTIYTPAPSHAPQPYDYKSKLIILKLDSMTNPKPITKPEQNM